VGRLLILAGAVRILVGRLLELGVPLGRLPGDIAIRRGGGSFYFPIVTCILVSIVLSILASWWRR
jgi:hypothetical protein